MYNLADNFMILSETQFMKQVYLSGIVWCIKREHNGVGNWEKSLIKYKWEKIIDTQYWR
jgi:hypothetical protein